MEEPVGGAGAVELGGVEVVDPEVDRAPQQGDGVGGVHGALTELHHAQAETRDPLAGELGQAAGMGLGVGGHAGLRRGRVDPTGGSSGSCPHPTPQPEEPPIPTTPARRADAVRNRERLLGAALRVLAAGTGPVSLEAVAREAGVGIGTLYRHFPTREALAEAVYRSELERLCARAPVLAESMPGDVALRAWMDEYADFVATKRGMGDALRAVIASGAVTSGQTRAAMSTAIGGLLEAGYAEGRLRDDVRPDDVTATLAGVLLAAAGPDDTATRAQVGRMLDLVVDGLRPPAATPPRSPPRGRTGARRGRA